MDHVLKKYCPRIEFDSYEDFAENFRIDVPADARAIAPTVARVLRIRSPNGAETMPISLR